MKSNSIRYRFVILIMMFLIPLLFILNFSNFYYCSLSQKQAARSGADLIALYMNQIDKSIEEISDSMRLFTTTSYMVKMLNSADADTRHYSNVEVYNTINNLVSNFNIADSLFVYGKKYESFTYVYGAGSTYHQRMLQNQYIQENCNNGKELDYQKWSRVELGGRNYLLWLMEYESVFTGAWIDVNTLETPLSAIPNSYNAEFIFSDLENNPLTNVDFIDMNGIKLNYCEDAYYKSGVSNKYIITDAQSEEGNFRLYMAFPEKSILADLDSLQLIILILSVCSLFLIPATLYLFKSNLLNPLQVLNEAVGELDRGNLDFQIKKTNAPFEFLHINNAFNKMIVRLRYHKIKEYEDRLDKQKLMLAYLKMQIRPHFFLNSLSTVTNFAKINQLDNMNRFVSYLAGYLRYMFRSNFTLVHLKEEVLHAENYLSMQEMCFSGTLSHMFDVQPEAQMIKVPPFIVYNFIENVVKHATRSKSHVMIYLQASIRDDMLFITIEDDGVGLTDEALDQLNDPGFKPSKGRNTGIWNIRQTLSILYNDKAEIKLSKSILSGAKVEISVPVEGAWEGGVSDENFDF